MNSTERRLPHWMLWCVLALVSLGIAFATAEIALRGISGPWTNSFFYIHDTELGTWHLRDFTGDNVSADYAVHSVYFNSFGMRDRERSISKEAGVTRIAFFGDSFIEGVQVSNDEVVTRYMEKLLGPGVEVLNIGVSGFGTTQELLAYRQRVRQFDPDIVILGFYTGNDVRNNSRELEDLYNGGSSDRPYAVKTENGWEFLAVPAKAGSGNPVILFLKRHFSLYRFLWFEKQRLQGLYGDLFAVADTRPIENTSSYMARLFAPPTSEPFIDAWNVTEYLLEEFKKDAESDGARFVLVAIPDPVALEPDPRAALEKAYGAPLPEKYDPEYPQKRLALFARNSDIEFLDLTPVFKEYRDTNRLPYPYFSFAHDGHWSSLGHGVAAEAIVDFLKTRKVLNNDQ